MNSLFKTPSNGEPKMSIFAGITKPPKAFEKNYFTAGQYLLSLQDVIVKRSENPRTKGIPTGVAVFKVLESEAPAVASPDGPQPVGATVSMTKYFQGSQADFHLRDWRNLMCAILQQDESNIDWESLTEEQVKEFEDACDHVAENPEEYKDVKVRCSATERVVEKDGETKRYVNTHFSLA